MIIKNFIYGLIIGLGFIIPGVSGGVLATILGIYEEIINRLNHLFKNFKENIIYLTPIIFGIIVSVIFFSKIIIYLLNNHLIFISYVFIGLILGCVPYLIQEIKIKTNKKISLLSFFLAFIFGIFLYYIEKYIPPQNINPSSLIMILAGLFYAVGKIIPGISGASLLMFLGIYKYFLNIIANPLAIDIKTIYIFIPFLISFFISAIFILKLSEYALKNHFRTFYSTIIGFVISSILFIYPNYFSISCLLILFCSFLISYYLSK